MATGVKRRQPMPVYGEYPIVQQSGPAKVCCRGVFTYSGWSLHPTTMPKRYVTCPQPM